MINGRCSLGKGGAPRVWATGRGKAITSTTLVVMFPA
jgi:hypothetical protein